MKANSYCWTADNLFYFPKSFVSPLYFLFFLIGPVIPPVEKGRMSNYVLAAASSRDWVSNRPSTFPSYTSSPHFPAFRSFLPALLLHTIWHSALSFLHFFSTLSGIPLFPSCTSSPHFPAFRSFHPTLLLHTFRHSALSFLLFLLFLHLIPLSPSYYIFLRLSALPVFPFLLFLYSAFFISYLQILYFFSCISFFISFHPLPSFLSFFPTLPLLSFLSFLS